MEVYTVDIRSWTASFRYPNLISGIQPTLEVPPLSTVLGLINAAAGKYVEHSRLSIGYYFEFGAKATDLETIYMIDSNKGRPTNNAKSNVIRREFLFDVFLRLYLTDENLISYFKAPYYPLLLGRMNDLASVDIKSIGRKQLNPVENADKISGQIVPFNNNYLPGTIQALPKYFSNTLPRQNMGTEPYSIINHYAKIKTNLLAYRDELNGKEVDIYLHQLDFENQ
ncbi:type I-B CRISPR-associated protein Cas5b [Niastella populi]|uniref:Type I-B CRISPR-associated protein Cas5 n=1 Tax=Niastella populi TaxID=550983 RepID=A0A1V9FNC4_9BACT|nr:type I-B CRISPR-associated protein Cas5b [Niastella populi]OQP59771.1 type I-B CRISPR-associated protein Cas5 [Niastella populi]